MFNMAYHEENLRKMLAFSFGYSTVEEEILKRCLSAIKFNTMNPLKAAIFISSWNGISCIPVQITMTAVCLKLFKLGIWQYVKTVIENKDSEDVLKEKLNDIVKK